MTTSKKKSLWWKELSAPLLVATVGIWTFLGMNWLWDLSSANSSSISDANRVSVEGVENSAQYLTSMVLHMWDEWPNDTKVVTLYYDTGAKALHISGNVNANALIIGNKNEALSGTTAIGGEGNKILDGSENALIMGGKDNSLASATNSIILGGRGTKAKSANNLAIIGASETSVPKEGISAPKKENILVAGGHGNIVRWSNVVILWEGNNEAGSDSVLIGKDIKAGNAQKVFVWSDNGTFSPKKSGAFYVNTKNGIWFNTNDPKVKFDIGGLGGKWAIKIAAKWGFVSASGKCDGQYAGLMAYVKAPWGKSGLCGCNGAERVPLSSDPSTHGVCVNMNQRACTGWVANAVLRTPVQALPKWNPELNEGDGGWEEVKWVYGGIQYPGSTGKECGYTCQTGYHAGVDFPDGWQMWGCLPSTEIPNRYTREKPDGSTFNGWWTPGTGNDNCHFGCKAGYKHKDQPGVERSCSGCNIGTYTPENNQRAECKDCVMPTINKQGLQEFITHASTRGGTATTINSGFKAWTTTGYSEYSCNFHCDERFAYKHDTNTTGSCSFCQPGTYSSGGVAQCASCTPIANATFITNGRKNRKDPSSSRLDCDFNCKPWYIYHNKWGDNRGCRPCQSNKDEGTRSAGGQQERCELCDPKPANSHYVGWNFTNKACKWECDEGFNLRWGQCILAQWKREEGQPYCDLGWAEGVARKNVWYTCTDGYGTVDPSVCRHRSQTNGGRVRVHTMSWCNATREEIGCGMCPEGIYCKWVPVPCTKRKYNKITGQFISQEIIYRYAECPCHPGRGMEERPSLPSTPSTPSVPSVPSVPGGPGSPSGPSCIKKWESCFNTQQCCHPLTCGWGHPSTYTCEWTYTEITPGRCDTYAIHSNGSRRYLGQERLCTNDTECDPSGSSWKNQLSSPNEHLESKCVGAQPQTRYCSNLIIWGGTYATYQQRCTEKTTCRFIDRNDGVPNTCR